jgi:hypothetical protein
MSRDVGFSTFIGRTDALDDETFYHNSRMQIRPEARFPASETASAGNAR